MVWMLAVARVWPLAGVGWLLVLIFLFAKGVLGVGVAGDAFPLGAWPLDAAVDMHKQAGRQSTALTGASSRSCHVTKRFRILATLTQGNKSMYSNTSGYVHMGLRLDWGKIIIRTVDTQSQLISQSQVRPSQWLAGAWAQTQPMPCSVRTLKPCQ